MERMDVIPVYSATTVLKSGFGAHIYYINPNRLIHQSCVFSNVEVSAVKINNRDLSLRVYQQIFGPDVVVPDPNFVEAL